MKEYDIIVVGGGHAGIEAALATSKMKNKTLLITINKKNIADMACNPSLGGSAKGVVVNEIAALGGTMPEIADKTKLQIKLLNKSRGPAVQSLRAQIDKIEYQKEMINILTNQPNLEIKEAVIEGLIVKKDEVVGVKTSDGGEIYSKKVILTTGTYLKSDVLIGNKRKREGPHSEKISNHLSDELKELGFKIIRLKTGTPPRIIKETVNFKVLTEEKGDKEQLFFGLGQPLYNAEEQLSCYLTYTNEKTHKIILDNIEKSSMYGGIKDLNSVGARYCPSVEDKIVRFKDKERHQIFLEPESIHYNDLYVQGLSTSMPYNIQQKMINSIVGLEKAEIKSYGYAIEYDAINPIQLKNTLETKIIKNLYTAGQINGTSGYEEAACQGLMAGINAGLAIKNKPPLILKRDEAYIGVLIDDLITKGITDPYRLLTSRAEYRLILRQDNYKERLIKYGYDLNLVGNQEYEKFKEEQLEKGKLIENFNNYYIKPKSEESKKLEKYNVFITKNKINIYDLLKRPELNLNILKNEGLIDSVNKNLIINIETEIKYEGYIKKSKEEANKLRKSESMLIPSNLDYDLVNNLASEAKQKLKEINPETIAQATRISGVNPSDISLLLIYLKKEKHE